MSEEVEVVVNPLADASLEAARADLQKVWKRIEQRAPEKVRARVTETLASADKIIGNPAARYLDRLALGKGLEDLCAEVRGRVAFIPTFYIDGRLAVVRAYDPITIRGSIDHVRIEQFFERYMRRAELAFERLEYFFTRAGLLQPKEKVKKPAWEQAYANIEQYRELIWGKVKKPEVAPPNRPKFS